MVNNVNEVVNYVTAARPSPRKKLEIHRTLSRFPTLGVLLALRVVCLKSCSFVFACLVTFCARSRLC